MTNIIPMPTNKRLAGKIALRIAQRLREANPNTRVIYRRKGKRAG